MDKKPTAPSTAFRQPFTPEERKKQERDRAERIRRHYGQPRRALRGLWHLILRPFGYKPKPFDPDAFELPGFLRYRGD